MLSSHHPKATLPEVKSSGVSGFDKNTKKLPPSQIIIFPFSVSTNVVSGSALLTKALIPPVGSPVTLDAYCNFTFALGGGCDT